jgi:hypothetical protein
MRTVLCSSAARRGVGLLAVLAAVGAAGNVTPASAAAKHRVGHHRGQHAAAGEAVLGPAVKYVRTADGSIRRVR